MTEQDQTSDIADDEDAEGHVHHLAIEDDDTEDDDTEGLVHHFAIEDDDTGGHSHRA